MDVSKGVVIGGLAVGSVLAALSAYVLYGAPWEEHHGSGELVGVCLNRVTAIGSHSSRLVCLQTRSRPGGGSGTLAILASSMLCYR